MDPIEALVFGIIQGLTEYLPVSSSGHLQLAAAFANFNDPDANLRFSILVHAATALSSIIVFRQYIGVLLKGLLKFSWNEETQYVAKLAISAIPAVGVGLFLEDYVDELFAGNLILVGSMWLVTAGLLLLTTLVKKQEGKVGFAHSIIIGISQAIAILPGLSRSGTTIATGLLLGLDREKVARFSFLMVIVPILGKAALDLKDLMDGSTSASVTDQLPTSAMIAGFIAAFITGLAACSLMLRIVRTGRLPYFSLYLVIVGILAIIAGLGVFG
jgi:undecaprenyl-diphosphatase